MTHLFERTALVLLAGTALVVSTGAGGAFAQPVLDIPAATAERAQVGQDVDAFARARSHGHKASGPAATYKVRKGDTLAEVADKLGTSIEALAKANRLKKPYRLTPGQTLKNPTAQKAAASETSSGKKSARSGSQAVSESYVVKSGDTLFSVAKKYGVSVADLKAANGLGRSNAIARGRKLKIPGAGGVEEAAPAPEPRSSSRREREPEAEAPAGRAVNGRVIEIPLAGKAYRVRRGESLERVADKLNSSTGELARINHLKKPYRLRAGQAIRGPGGTAKAYVVARGDTLATIAERFDVTLEKLRTTNGLRRGAAVAPGRQLRLPSGFRDRGPIRMSEPEENTQPAYRPPPASQTPPRAGSPEGLPSAPQPYSPSSRPRQTIPGYTPPPSSGGVNGGPTTGPQVSDAQIMQLGRGLFQWPLKGQLLSGFGDKGAGQRNDGLNIRANTGDSVRAAAAGEVIYAGDQVPGFGNLVLISHPDGWVTAYSNLSKIGVRMREKVSQGQEIGLAGSTGGVSEPQVHFEVRYRSNPQEKYRAVDPALVLPK